MTTTLRRLGVMVSLSILPGLASCGEVDQHEVDRHYEGPAVTLVAREGMAVLEIQDDEVLFEGLPFEGTVTIFPIETVTVTGPANIVKSSAGRKLSYVFDDRGTMEVSVSDDDGGMADFSNFTVTLGGEKSSRLAVEPGRTS